MTSHSTFPLRGIIGVVANSLAEIDSAIAAKLQCVELRADLLLDAGLSIDDIHAGIAQAQQASLAVLFTLRHPDHGGKFNGSEAERVSISRDAFKAGADIVDLEWDSKAAASLITESVPMILSYHNFNGMPDADELARVTRIMSQHQPAAIKIVPTASGSEDALRMLGWVADADGEIARIGFAMGAAGACSRILTVAMGGPVTYTAFGPAVAPGQVALDALLNSYRVMQMTGNTRLVAVVGSDTDAEQHVAELNQQFREAAADSVAVAFPVAANNALQHYRISLHIADIVAL